jgi:rhodanese-related sulfurtransferase
MSHRPLGHQQPIVVLCSEGYASSFAAATLRRLGVEHATDVTGGFHAWRRAGLPVVGGGAAAGYRDVC